MTPAAAIDWARAHERLERARHALEAGGELSADETRRLLEDRARALAQPLEETVLEREPLSLLGFSVGGERYAVDARRVVEVVALGEPTPVPRTPPFVLGVVNHRGAIVAVLDVAQLISTGGPVGPRRMAVLVGAGDVVLGIAADAVEGTAPLADELTSPPPEGFVRGVTGDLVAVLDVDALAADRRLEMDHSG